MVFVPQKNGITSQEDRALVDCGLVDQTGDSFLERTESDAFIYFSIKINFKHVSQVFGYILRMTYDLHIFQGHSPTTWHVSHLKV